MTRNPAHDDDLTGRTLAGTYRIEEVIGRGAMGVVYAARHELMGERFAVKVIHAELAADEHVRARLVQEARTLMRLNHQHIVQLRHCGEEEGLLFLVMDLCAGESLRAVLEREGALPESRAVAVTDMILDALRQAHEVGIVHRDLKPDNVMLDEGDRVRVLDFGLARILRPLEQQMPGTQVTVEGQLVGTVAYMSPEQVRASPDVDERSDLFSAGVVLYEMLTGKPPFSSDSAFSVMMQILEHPIPSIAIEGAGSVSEHTRAVVSRALERDPARRFQTAGAFREALGGAPLAAPSRTSVRAAGPSVPRRRARVLGVAALALAAVLAVWIIRALDEDDPASLRAEATRAMETCAFRDAVKLFARLHRTNEATGEDHLRAAEARILAGDPNAKEDLNRAQYELGETPEVLVMWSRFHWRTGDDEQSADAAVNALGNALLKAPRHVEARLWRLRFLLDQEAAVRLHDPRGRRLRIAQDDIDELRKHASDHPELPLATSRLALARAETAEPGAKRSASLSVASEQAEAAVMRDPRSAAALLAKAWVAVRAAGDATENGAYDTATSQWQAAIEALTLGLRRIDEHPTYRCQVDLRGDLLELRSGCYYHVGDFDRVTADLKALGEIRDDANYLMGLAVSLRNAGRLEEAMRLYELLKGKHAVGAYFDLAYCHQAEGRMHRRNGDRAEARASYDHAIENYTTGMEIQGENAVLLAYRGETYVRRAEVADTPDDDLAAAGRDFARARELSSASEEVSYRYAEYLTVTGDLDEAREVMRRTIGDAKDKNPSMYGRYARTLIACAARDVASDRAKALAFLDTADDQLDRIDSMHPASRSGVRYLRGQVALVRGDLAAAQGLFEEASKLTREDRAWLSTTAALAAAETSLRREATPASAEQTSSWTLRLEEMAAGRWSHSAAYYQQLGDVLASAALPDLAAAAQERARLLGR